MKKNLVNLLPLIAVFFFAVPADAQAVLRTINGTGQFGRSAGFAGDLNGDGFPESFSLGLPPSGSGPTFAYSIDGRTGIQSPLNNLVSPVISLKRLGDLDGDGRYEVLVEGTGSYYEVLSALNGSMRYTLPSGSYRAVGDVDADGIADLGRFYNLNGIALCSGATGQTIGSATGVFFAQVYCNWGDLNSDGRDDFLLASAVADQWNPGSSRIVSGVDGSLLAPLPFTTLKDAVYLGRIDGDLLGEVAVATSGGQIQVLSGATHAAMYSIPAGGNLGKLLAAGDVDLDGAHDFVALTSVGSGSAARLTLHSGVDGAPILIYNSTSGLEIDAGSDLNRDGYPDLVLGDSAYPSSATPNGRMIFLSGAPTPPLTYCQGKINSLGCEPYVWASGSTSRSGPDNLVVHAANVLNNKLGIMFWGRQGSSAPFLGGTLCISTPFKRTDSQSSGGSSAGSDCSGTFSYAFSQAEMAQNGLGVGSAGYCQFWYRDPGFPSPANVGLTNGVVFTVSF